MILMLMFVVLSTKQANQIKTRLDINDKLIMK